MCWNTANCPPSYPIPPMGAKVPMPDNAARRALILDFDGVLVDTEPVHFESWNAAFEELHGIRREGDHTQLVGLSLAEIFRLWSAPHDLTLSAAMQQWLLARKTE
ncbi:MAG: HAD family phosphatase, partial [Chloroflexi bacterium]|nr:HAD family phosphatase [Chloroflexota bacterium]